MAPSTRLAPSHDRRKAVSPASSSSSSSYINPNPRTYINPNPRTKGRITRGRQVFATKITARTIVFPRLLERLGADAARRTVAPCSERTSTVSVTDNGHNDGNDHTDDMTITLHTEDVPAQSYTISRTQPIDFGWIKKRDFKKRARCNAATTMKHNGVLIKASAKFTAKDLGLSDNAVIEVMFWYN